MRSTWHGMISTKKKLPRVTPGLITNENTLNQPTSRFLPVASYSFGSELL